jgi:hypothetical protein
MKSFVKIEFILENGSHSEMEILGCDTTLMGKSCRALVAQSLLVKFLCAEMPEYCGRCGKFM